MNTTINKAIVAILGGLLTVLATFGLDLDISDELLSGSGAVLTGVLVYFVPNKE